MKNKKTIKKSIEKSKDTNENLQEKKIKGKKQIILKKSF